MVDQTTLVAPLIADPRRVHVAMRRVDRDGAAYLAAITDAAAGQREKLAPLPRAAQPRLEKPSTSARLDWGVIAGTDGIPRAIRARGGAAGAASTWRSSWTDVGDAPPLTEEAGEVLLAAHTDALFGQAPAARSESW
jgi:hypothetical protein